MAKASFSIEKNFVVVSPDKTATNEKNDSGLYERLDNNYNGFKAHELISCHEFDRSWSSWEIHTHGDEVVILLSGEATIVLQFEEGEKSVVLAESGMSAIVPGNVWHTVKTNENQLKN